MTTSEPDPITQLMDKILAFCRSQGLGTVARLGIPDLLATGPKSAEELARSCGADPAYLYRMLRALALEGVFEEQDGRVFAQTPMSDGLTTAHARSVRWLAASMCDHAHWQPWGNCYQAIVEGRSQTPKVLGTSPWEYLSGNPEEAGRFGRAMTHMSGHVIAGIKQSYDFNGFEQIVDVGGNRGALLVELLWLNENPAGTIFDLPSVIDVAREELEDHPLAERITLAEGDFFDAVPAGADAYLLKHILHDWPDDACVRILRNIREAIRDDGKLLVFDALLVPGAPAWTHWLDVHMMILQDGKERSPDEFAALLAESGFELSKVIPLPSPVGIIEAVPV